MPGLTRAPALLQRLLGLARGGTRADAAATLLPFWIGAALALSWTIPATGAAGVVGLSAALTAAAAACVLPRAPGVLRVGSLLLLLLVHLVWLAQAVALGGVLAWSVPGWLWIAVGVGAAAAVATAARQTRVRVPLALPLGLAIAAFASGWMYEDGLLRCDDYLRLRASGATLALPSTPELARCGAGEGLVIARYPRHFWEDPRGDRFVVTTQRGDHAYTPPWRSGRRVDDWLDGAVCAAPIGTGEAPACFGEGKAHGILESSSRDRLYVPTHDGRRTVVYALPRDGPLAPLAQAPLPAKGGAFYIDDEHDILGFTEDDGEFIHLLRASDLTPLDAVPAPFIADQAHYDARSNEGIACGSGTSSDGGRFAAAAFTSNPLVFRPLAPTSRHPLSWFAATWGCDWDPVTRRAYVAGATLGIIEEIDYDSGDVLRRFFVGPGARALSFDAGRRLIYAGFFLSGTVIALDADSGAVVGRWPAGRFVRSLKLSRDRQALLVASSLGIVRIPLGGLRPAQAG